MMSESRIKREVADVRRSQGTPLAKARKILRMARRCRDSAFRMAALSRWFLSQGDALRGLRFRNVALKLIEHYNSLRGDAGMMLRDGPVRQLVMSG